MALKRMVLELGMGTDIRGADYTKAAVRALRDALWHNSLSIADAVGSPADSCPHAMIKDGGPKMIRMAGEVASNCLVRSEIRNLGEAELAHPFHQPGWFEKAAHWFTARRRDCHHHR